MSQNGQTHFKNLAAFTTRFLEHVCDHFGALCMKGLSCFLHDYGIFHIKLLYRTLTLHFFTTKKNVRVFWLFQGHKCCES